MPSPIRVLFAALRYDYNVRGRGLSFEYENFYETLRRMEGVECTFFDSGGLMLQPDALQHLLVRKAIETVPHILFVFPFEWEILPDTVRAVSSKTGALTLCWFADDHWRFDTFSRQYCRAFDYCVTTDSNAVERYRSAGYSNVILSQWACNPHRYHKLDLPRIHPVTFVGMAHGNRRDLVSRLESRGIEVQCFGFGWKRVRGFYRKWNRWVDRLPFGLPYAGAGRVSHSAMIRIFNQSRINLNFANSSQGDKQQIKGRNFEIPGCGGFILTSEAEGLDRYFSPGKEVVTYSDFEDLVDKIRYYLVQGEEREAIAEMGYLRVLRDHTYEKRFRAIFEIVLGKSGSPG